MLQEREFERLGSGQPIATDVRVLAGTNRDLMAAVAAGLFRIVLFGLLGGERLEGWTALFLASTAVTSATGFGFPFSQLLPSHIVVGLSPVVPAFAIRRATRFTLPVPGVRSTSAALPPRSIRMSSSWSPRPS